MCCPKPLSSFRKFFYQINGRLRRVCRASLFAARSISVIFKGSSVNPAISAASRFAIQILLEDHFCRARILKCLGVLSLMIVRRRRQRYHYRCLPSRSNLGTRRCTGTANNKSAFAKFDCISDIYGRMSALAQSAAA